jgi:nicotinamidase-related amidase
MPLPAMNRRNFAGGEAMGCKAWTSIVLGSAVLAGLLGAAPIGAQQLNPKETAILFVDFQNEFVSEKGILNPIVKSEMARKNLLQNALETVREARQRGILVVQVTAGYSPDYFEVDMANPGLFHRITKARKAFASGSPGAELWEPLRPGPGDSDIVMKGRRAMSGFQGTDLDYILRTRGIKSLGIGGFMTNICVEHTARHAYDLGYHNYFLLDVMAARNVEEQTFTEKANFPFIGKLTTWREFMDMVPKTPAQTGR